MGILLFDDGDYRIRTGNEATNGELEIVDSINNVTFGYGGAGFDHPTGTIGDVTYSNTVTYPDNVALSSHPSTGERNLQPEGEQTGLAADAVGIKYSGKLTQTIDQAVLDGSSSIRLEAATSSSAGDEVVTVELYDSTAAVVADSMTITGGGQASLNVGASLAGGNDVQVRWNVTTASATAGATFDAINARLVVV